MVFYVFDRGIRQEESLSRLLQTQQARETQATASIRKVAKKTRDHQRGGTGASAYKEAQKEKKRQPVLVVEQVMTSPVITLNARATIQDAWKVFRQSSFHHIPIVNNEHQLTGILSDGDIFRFTSSLEPGGATRSGKSRLVDIAQQRVISVSPSTSIFELADLMVNRRIACLPVTNENNHVAGIVTRTDILRTLVKQAPLELWV